MEENTEDKIIFFKKKKRNLNFIINCPMTSHCFKLNFTELYYAITMLTMTGAWRNN